VKAHPLVLPVATTEETKSLLAFVTDSTGCQDGAYGRATVAAEAVDARPPAIAPPAAITAENFTSLFHMIEIAPFNSCGNGCQFALTQGHKPPAAKRLTRSGPRAAANIRRPGPAPGYEYW